MNKRNKALAINYGYLISITIASFSSPRLKNDHIHEGSVLEALLFLHPLQWQC